MKFWLNNKINLGKYSKAFEEMAVDGELIDYITEKDLENDFNVDVRLHRIKIMKHINQMKQLRVRNLKTLDIEKYDGSFQ